MKSNEILVYSSGKGFESAVAEAAKVAEYEHLPARDTLHLQLITEEMLSLVRSVTGELQASFWIENEGTQYILHLKTRTALNKEERAELLSVATTRKNEAAKSFLGYLRDRFEMAMALEVDHSDDIPWDIMSDLANHTFNDPEWDGYERSVLRKVSDEIKMFIRGGVVEMTVYRNFAS